MSGREIEDTDAEVLAGWGETELLLLLHWEEEVRQEMGGRAWSLGLTAPCVAAAFSCLEGLVESLSVSAPACWTFGLLSAEVMEAAEPGSVWPAGFPLILCARAVIRVKLLEGLSEEIDASVRRGICLGFLLCDWFPFFFVDFFWTESAFLVCFFPARLRFFFFSPFPFSPSSLKSSCWISSPCSEVGFS